MLIDTSITGDLIIEYGIKLLPHHLFTDKGLLQISHCPRRRTLPTKFLSQQTKGNRCEGYYIDKRFHSLSSLKKRAYPITKVILHQENICPF